MAPYLRSIADLAAVSPPSIQLSLAASTVLHSSLSVSSFRDTRSSSFAGILTRLVRAIVADEVGTLMTTTATVERHRKFPFRHARLPRERSALPRMRRPKIVQLFSRCAKRRLTPGRMHDEAHQSAVKNQPSERLSTAARTSRETPLATGESVVSGPRKRSVNFISAVRKISPLK